MSVRNREQAGIFCPLPATGYAKLAEDAELRSHYLDVLSYMHDLAVSFWDQPEPARFTTQDAIIDMGILIQRHFSEGDSLSEHVQQNAESAQFFGAQGETIILEGTDRDRENLQREATLFMKGILFTYNQVRSV